MAPGDDPDAAPTLAELRLRIQALATADGEYIVACARTGDVPVPVDGYRFEERATAAEAARYASEYRAQLRQLDPRTPHYDPVVHEVVEDDRVGLPDITVAGGSATAGETATDRVSTERER